MIGNRTTVMAIAMPRLMRDRWRSNHCSGLLPRLLLQIPVENNLLDLLIIKNTTRAKKPIHCPSFLVIVPPSSGQVRNAEIAGL